MALPLTWGVIAALIKSSAYERSSSSRIVETLSRCQSHIAWENPILIWGHKNLILIILVQQTSEANGIIVAKKLIQIKTIKQTNSELLMIY